MTGIAALGQKVNTIHLNFIFFASDTLAWKRALFTATNSLFFNFGHPKQLIYMTSLHNLLNGTRAFTTRQPDPILQE